MRKSLEQRLLALVEPELNTGCWLWTGNMDMRWGYGRIRGADGVKTAAHRVSYSVFKGEIPKRQLVCHRCDTPACINPDHLFLGSPAANMQDMVTKGRNKPQRGEESYWARLTDADVVLMRRRWKAGETQADIARSLGLIPSHVQRIVQGLAWAHVHEDDGAAA